MAVEKFRSPELLKLAAEQSCTLRIKPGCVNGPCVCCHSNQGKHGKGKSTKAHDCFVAFGCAPCHAELDQGKNLTQAQKNEIWDRAHIETLPILLAKAFQTVAKRPRAEPARGTALTSSKIFPRPYA